MTEFCSQGTISLFYSNTNDVHLYHDYITVYVRIDLLSHSVKWKQFKYCTNTPGLFNIFFKMFTDKVRHISLVYTFIWNKVWNWHNVDWCWRHQISLILSFKSLLYIFHMSQKYYLQHKTWIFYIFLYCSCLLYTSRCV